MNSSVELKCAEEVEDFKLEKAILSETGLIIHLSHKYSLIDMFTNTLTISDELGNVYLSGTGMSDDYIMKYLFPDLTKNNFNKKIYLNIDIPKLNINKRIELVEK